MTILEEARTVLGQLTPEDRLKFLESLAHETVEVSPGIFRTPGVCGGEACICAMRLPVWLLEEGRKRGATEEQLLQAHPDLTSDDLAHAWDYVRMHREEINRTMEDANWSAGLKTGFGQEDARKPVTNRRSVWNRLRFFLQSLNRHHLSTLHQQNQFADRTVHSNLSTAPLR